MPDVTANMMITLDGYATGEGQSLENPFGDIEAALEQARQAAGERNVSIAGGPGTLNKYLAANLVDELRLHVAPFVAGGGVRIFDGVDNLDLQPISSRTAPSVTHLVYRRR